jgi:hypothetical protein
LILIVLGAAPLLAQEPKNLLKNPGFEQELAGVWEARTPADQQRKLERQQGESHSGNWCLVLENRDGKLTRLRQGNDRSLTVPPNSLVELSAWVKPQLGDNGRVGIQIYCMDEKGKILAQPQAQLPNTKDDWQRVRLLAKIPQDTAYTMVYLQTDRAAGKVLFDDAELRIVRKPLPPQPVAKIGLFTDLAQTDECYRSVKTLLGNGLVEVKGDSLAADLAKCEGAVVLLQSGQVTPQAMEPLAAFVRQGRSVFMDLRAFAAWQGLSLADCRLIAPAKKGEGNPTNNAALRQMQVGLTVVKGTPITAGFLVGQIVPYAGPKGQLKVLASLPPDKAIDVLATADGKPALVQMRLGKGRIVAADTLSLREPHGRNIDAYYKYLFAANTLAKADRLMLAEYYPRKLTYAEFVDAMRKTVKEHPNLRLEEEGSACGDYKMYSLNIGKAGAPMYFLYAAAHGVEWEPGYGLLTFAKHLAEGRLAKTIDLDKVCVKIVPILNPSGYDLRQRQNAHGVDLNRTGDHCWEQYKGRDSNGDGRYGPKDYDWKGDRPFGEPESQTFRHIVAAPNLHCTLEFHGNTSAQNNKVAIVPITAREDTFERVLGLQELVNSRLHMRYVLHQNDEETISPYLLVNVHHDSNRPVLQNTGARGRYGMLVELAAGYADSYGTVLQTEVTCEICRALFEIFPPQ